MRLLPTAVSGRKLGGMLCLLGVPRWAVLQYHAVLARHGQWMLWNTLLALIPLALAWFLLRRERQRTARWWLGVGTAVAFLPNAPYVLTDVIHFFNDVRRGADDLQALTVLAPVYAGFIAVGFGAYAATLRMTRRYLAALGWTRRRSAVVELTLHASSAVGVYLGRVVRLNSWSLLTDPRGVLHSLVAMLNSYTIVAILVAFGVLVAGEIVVEAIYDGLRVRFLRNGFGLGR